ncbi:MAG TPA: hypothetical protein VGS78_06435 [Candidatus Sulfotelmatobacter sp.]|nr:hypothetical protein [Candidatus Sulfotelmatobacter sp.]
MTSRIARWASILLVATTAVPARAQRHHDPLTEAEINQIRDTSWEPGRRLPLYVGFARARLVKMEQMRSDPKTKNRGQQTHDLLDEFQALYDELNDNIDTYVDRRDDIRKPLKTVLDADTEFQSKLRALKDAANVSPQEAAMYEFVLTNAIDAVDSATNDHRKLLNDQEEQAKHKRLNKHPSEGTGVAPE